MKNCMIFAAALAVLLSATAGAEHWPTGYYQDNFSDPYYYDDEYRWYCHIQTPTQGYLYDVASQVRKIGSMWDVLTLGISLGDCPWPNGFYQVASAEGPVYRLYPGNICTITSSEMLDAYGGTYNVIPAEDYANFSVQRTNTGDCFWPSWDEAAGIIVDNDEDNAPQEP